LFRDKNILPSESLKLNYQEAILTDAFILQNIEDVEEAKEN
jgi:hypothetical protein